MGKRVSIIVRAKNEEYWLPRLLQQLAKQRHQDFDVILVDNSSTDNTIEIFRHYRPHDKVLQIGDFLPGKAINIGIEAADNDLIAIISAHCVPSDENWLSSFVSVMENETLGAAYGRQLPLATSHPLDKRDLLNMFGIEYRIQKKDTFFHNANSIIRRSAWQNFRFDEETPHIEDRLWADKLIHNNIWIAYTPDACVYHHHGVNHHENAKRAAAISRILGKNNLGYTDDLPAFMAARNSQTLYCLLGHSQQSDRFLQKIVSGIKVTEAPGKFFVHSRTQGNKPDANITFVPYGNPDQELNFVQLLGKLLAHARETGFYPDAVAYLNLNAPGANPESLNKAVHTYYDGMYDSVFWANVEYGNIWQKTDEAYTQIRADYTRKEKKEPVYISRYGHGFVTRPAFIRNEELVGKKVAILQLD
jgi:rhamnosyltransferase